MPGETEGQNLSQENKKIIQIEAPERLEVGQNLYDQEPFLSLVKSIAQSTGQTLSKLHTAISLIAKVHSMDPKLQTTLLLRKAHVSVRSDSNILWDSQIKILETLQMYPYLSEYIVQQRQNELYANNGKFLKHHHGKGEPPALSYANWVTQKLEREKLLVSVGIEEIFPKDVSHPVTSQPNVTGLRPANRRYAILKAAEIIK